MENLTVNQEDGNILYEKCQGKWIVCHHSSINDQLVLIPTSETKITDKTTDSITIQQKFTDNEINLQLTCEFRNSSSGITYEATLQNQWSRPIHLTLAFQWLLPGHPHDYYSLFPGSVVAHNNADQILPGTYPVRLDSFDHVTPNGPRITGDIPRFTAESGYELYQQVTDLTKPYAVMYNDHAQSAFWQHAKLSNLQYIPGFLLNQQDNGIAFTCHFPLVRKKRFRHVGNWQQSPDQYYSLCSSTPLTIQGSFGTINCESRKKLLLKFNRLTENQDKGKWGDNHVSFEEGFKLIENLLNQYSWDEELSFYADYLDSKRLQTGWVSGTVTAYCLLHSSDCETRRRALKMIDFIVSKGVSESGLLLGIYGKDKWYGIEFDEGLDYAGRLVRRVADALYYLLKILNKQLISDSVLEEKCNEAAKLSLDVFAKLADHYGHFGHSIDFNTGDILWGGSPTGAIVLACLAEGARLFNDKQYLESAEKAAPYYADFIDQADAFAGPGDILMASDSESAYALVQGFWALYEATQKSTYLDSARYAAELFATWVYSEDYMFPEGTPHGNLGIRSRGLVMANTQNKHGAPGICTASGIELYELSKVTKDSFYRNLLHDIKSAMPQCMCYSEGRLPNVVLGAIPEDVNIADSLQDRGEFYPGGQWPATAFMLMHIESP